MKSEKVCLNWNDFQGNLNIAFKNLREDNDFNDVTLACEDGSQVEAHKVVLAASSPVFQKLLRRNKHIHPLIYMRGMKSRDLLAIVDFLYFGEANVFQEDLDSFLGIAEELQVKGLMGKYEEPEYVNQEIIPKSGEVLNPTRVATKDQKDEATKVFAPRVDTKATERAVARKGHFSEDLSQLDAQIESMMEMSQNLVSHATHRATVCTACGKEGKRNDIRRHIEANHLEGLSFPCNLCEKECRSRHAISRHKQKHH